MEIFSKLANELSSKFNKLLRKEEEVKKAEKNITSIEERISIQIENIRQEIKIRELELKAKERAIQKISSEKSIGFPWLVEAIVEFEEYFDLKKAEKLKSKKHPAIKSAEIVKEISKEKKLLKRELKLTKNYISYYESLFPWLKDYIDEDLDELLLQIRRPKLNEEEEDPVRIIIGDVKYTTLSSKERNELALKKYLERRKNWQIGRDYERFIGYLYEKEGYEVSYQGIIEGYEDLGRDLICTKKGIIKVVQCKCWSKYKVIREKHINQLYGTTIKYVIDHDIKMEDNYKDSLFPKFNSEVQIKPVFVTSTEFSDTARSFANALGVELIENKKFEDYPLIKCNFSKSGEKIYHLPFDQQYDKVNMNKPNCFFAHTVAEAEDRDFRRAYRWKGNKK